jgi:hypothetical protein
MSNSDAARLLTLHAMDAVAVIVAVTVARLLSGPLVVVAACWDVC